MQPRSPSTEPTETLQPGDLLAGRYRVHRVIGSGGMGVVVEAYHLELAHRVAIKLLKSSAAKRVSTLERFLQEARASVRLHGQHVARVTDVGRLEDGRPYIVMEYLHGRDLAQWLQERGPMPVQQAVDQAARAGVSVARHRGVATRARLGARRCGRAGARRGHLLRPSGIVEVVRRRDRVP